MKLIDKDALVAEIERRKAINEKAYMQAFLNSNDNRDSFGYKVQEDIDTLSFIDTLEVKEVDLEKEIDKVWDTNYEDFGIPVDDFYRVARYFFKLGLKAQKGE